MLSTWPKADTCVLSRLSPLPRKEKYWTSFALAFAAAYRAWRNFLIRHLLGRTQYPCELHPEHPPKPRFG